MIILTRLVYCSVVKANFVDMMRLLRFRVLMQLGSDHNQPSLMALDNLVDLIVTCLTHPDAAKNTFLVISDEDVSTLELFQHIG